MTIRHSPASAPPARANAALSRVHEDAPHDAGWRYHGDGARDLRLDLLRGFAVLAMVADHLGTDLGSGDSWLFAITGGDRFLFSAAEAFVFISGLVMGIVYRRIIDRRGLGAATLKALRRAGRLYLLTIGLSFTLMAVGYAFGLPWPMDLRAPDPLATIVARLTMHRAFYRTDVLLLYTMLVAAAPLAFVLLARRRTLVLLLLSWTLWSLHRRWPAAVDLPWHVEDNPMFHFVTWQVLFFTALAIGYHRDRIAAWAQRRRIPLRPSLAGPAALAGLGLLCAGLIWFHVHSLDLLAPFAPGGDAQALFVRLFDKPSVRIGRVAAFAVFFQFAFLLLTMAWRPIVKAVGWLLLPLGRHALLAYGAHLFVSALFIRYVPRIPLLAAGTAWTNTIVQAAGIAIVYAVVRLASAVRHRAIANAIVGREATAA